MDMEKKLMRFIPCTGKNVYKILPILILGSLLTSSISTIGFIGDSKEMDESITRTTMSLTKPLVFEENEYLRVELMEETSLLLDTGKPVIPVVSKTFNFPMGTKITQIQVNIETEPYPLEKKIVPSPRPVPQCLPPDPEFTLDVVPDETIYSSAELYPQKDFSIRKGVGLHEGERVLFVTVHSYAQYSPRNNVIHIPTNIHIEINHNPPSSPLPVLDTYDMLIITDEKFTSNLQPLVDHKNSIGIKTVMETTQKIYSQYNGRDDPEDIKLRIKDAIEEWGITYVLLGGGRKGQTFEWYIPERRSNNDADTESGYSTDLYYADIYDDDGFEDWDSNGNGIFAEYDPTLGTKRDIIDFYPDVMVGRLPFRYTWEADAIVDKIITYENTADDSWFKNAFVASGDTSPPARDEGRGITTYGVYEGEIVTNIAAGYLEKKDFIVDRLYTSNGRFSTYNDIVKAVDDGVGFAYPAGHGSPSVWGNFHPDGETEDDFTLGFTIYDIWKYSNGYKLPVLVVGGCHNAQFNITMQNLVEYELEKIGESYPADGCSWGLLMEGGGSIGSIGYTGFGYGYINEYCTQGLGGWIGPRFFHAYASQGKTHLGEAHSQAIIDYIQIVDNVDHDQIDRKSIEGWILLGDPSLAIGGLHALAHETLNDKDNGTPVEKESSQERTIGLDEGVPDWEVGTRWTYEVNDIDFSLHQIEGRDIDIHMEAGDIILEVTEVTENTYQTDFIIEDGDIDISLNLDMGTGTGPVFLTGHLMTGSAEGNIAWDRSNLGITGIEVELTGKIDLSSLPLELPRLLQVLLNFIPSTITIQVQADFNVSYPILDFPLNTSNSWGLPAVGITLDGTADSFLFKIARLANLLASLLGQSFLPPEIAQLLPVIDISEMLDVLNMSNPLGIPRMMDPVYHDIHMFSCSSQETIAIKAGTFTTYKIPMVREIGLIHYSPEAKNIVKVTGNFGEIIPFMDNITLELVQRET